MLPSIHTTKLVKFFDQDGERERAREGERKREREGREVRNKVLFLIYKLYLATQTFGKVMIDEFYI